LSLEKADTENETTRLVVVPSSVSLQRAQEAAVEAVVRSGCRVS